MDIDRNNLFLVDQWVTAFADVDIAFGIKDRSCGIHIHGKGSAGKDKAVEAGIEEVVFDRGGFVYHGKVKALADAAREAGLKF